MTNFIYKIYLQMYTQCHTVINQNQMNQKNQNLLLVVGVVLGVPGGTEVDAGMS